MFIRWDVFNRQSSREQKFRPEILGTSNSLLFCFAIFGIRLRKKSGMLSTTSSFGHCWLNAVWHGTEKSQSFLSPRLIDTFVLFVLTLCTYFSLLPLFCICKCYTDFFSYFPCFVWFFLFPKSTRKSVFLQIYRTDYSFWQLRTCLFDFEGELSNIRVEHKCISSGDQCLVSKRSTTCACRWLFSDEFAI